MAASGGLLTGAAGVPNSTLCGFKLDDRNWKILCCFSHLEEGWQHQEGCLLGLLGYPIPLSVASNLMTETGKFYAVFHTKFLAPARADKLTIKCMDFRSAGDTTVKVFLIATACSG